MSLRTLISKLNWRQVAAHLLATFFFMAAFYVFCYLIDTELITILRTTTPEDRFEVLDARGKTASDLTYFVLWLKLSPFFGLLTAFGVSLCISIRQRWYWINSLLVFLIGFLLLKIGVAWFGISAVQTLTLHWGLLIKNIHLEFIISGTIWLLIGLVLFFNRKTFQFITTTSANTSFPK